MVIARLHTFRLLILSGIALAVCGCSVFRDAGDNGRQRLNSRLSRILDGPVLGSAQCGVVVRSAVTGEVVYACNGDRQMTPASNVKLITAAAALLAFGPDHRFSTRLIPVGAFEDGILQGDLYIVSDGDPTLRSEFSRAAAGVFRDWAGHLRRQGIRGIGGALIGVDIPPGLDLYGAGWALDDLPWSYAPAVSRLQMDGNAAILEITAADLAGKPSWRIVPAEAGTGVAGELSWGGKTTIALDWRPLQPGIALSGTVLPSPLPVAQAIAIHDPAQVYTAVVARVFGEEGIRVAGGADLQSAGPAGGGDPLHVDSSPPLREILAVMLKESDNLIAETLVRALGDKAVGEFSFTAGRGAARGILLPLGVDLDQGRYADGSGLSRYNHLSPGQLSALLAAMVRGGGRTTDLWRGLLPVAAREGTLAKHFAETPLAGNLCGKTGSMSSVRALAGYFESAAGEPFVFSIMVNGHTAPGGDVDRAIEELLLLLHHHL